MITVLFEVTTKEGCFEEYLKIAESLKSRLSQYRGPIHGERFYSLVNKDKLLSMSTWENEDDIRRWRKDSFHRSGQSLAQKEIFESYRITVTDSNVNNDRQIIVLETSKSQELMEILRAAKISYDIYKSFISDKLICIIDEDKHMDINKLNGQCYKLCHHTILRQYSMNKCDEAPE